MNRRTGIQPAPVSQATLDAQVAQDMAETVDVALVWLNGRTSAEPWRFAHQLMVAGVFRQAGLLGLLDCTRCGDRGCDWCQAQR